MLLLIFLLMIPIFTATHSQNSNETWFPITAWDIIHDKVSRVSWIDSSLITWHGNSILLGWKNDAITQAFLERGEKTDIDFILYGLTAGNDIALKNMARGQFSVYESEEHRPTSIKSWPPKHGYFDINYCVGQSLSDPKASSGIAWKALAGSDTAGYMQAGLHQHDEYLQEYSELPVGPYIYERAFRYEARFYLKIPDTNSDADVPVCRIEAWTEDKDCDAISIIDSLTIFTSDFSDASSYDSFSLWFTINKAMSGIGRMDYRIWWFGNHDLCADKVELRDEVFWNLERNDYDDEMLNIVKKWNDYTPLRYYYLWDEPHLDQFESFKRISAYLTKLKAKPAITAINHRYNHYHLYSEFIRTCYGDAKTPLLIDKYVLRPKDDTPLEIQDRFDLLCTVLDNARISADTTGTISRNVWYICQTHSYTKETGTVVLREPTPQEIWALVGLGLAHGAKGIWYFMYMSQYYSNASIKFRALVDSTPHGWAHNSKWSATKDINAVLEVLDTLLLNLDFLNSFNGKDLQNYVQYVSLGGFAEFGLFENKNHEEFFCIVNRTDNYNRSDTIYPQIERKQPTVVLGLDANLHSGSYSIKNCHSGELHQPDSIGKRANTMVSYFKFSLDDCHFKFFQIVPHARNKPYN